MWIKGSACTRREWIFFFFFSLFVIFYFLFFFLIHDGNRGLLRTVAMGRVTETSKKRQSKRKIKREKRDKKKRLTHDQNLKI